MSVGYVYFIMADEVKRFKIGKASALPKRFGGLDTASPCEIDVWGVIKSDTYEKIEKELHQRFRKQRLRKKNGRKKEWFAISENEAAAAIEQYGGIYTAFTEVAQSGTAKNSGDSFLAKTFIRVGDIFPAAKPHIVILMLCMVCVFLFQVALPTAYLHGISIPR